MKLLIVESPAKARTISGYLKDLNGWKVMASKGHIKNLPVNEHAITHENGKFVGKWVIIDDEKKTLVASLKEEAKKAEGVWIATDGDFEGERIASDLIDELGLKKLGKPYYRIIFREITKSHIVEILRGEGSGLNTHSVEAQMARRMLDREIGYPLSNIIEMDFKRNGEEEKPNGIGRVISAALAIVVETEKHCREFVSQPYKKIFADYVISGIQVRLYNKLKYFEESELELEDTLAVIRKSPHIVSVYEEKMHEKAPPKPLTTSAMQRGMNYINGFDEPYTMKLAQRLFEGIEIYGERLGLITYMRTDSYNISTEATDEAIRICSAMFGDDSTMRQKRTYKNREGAHEAHEAIRPTQYSDEFLPENIKEEMWKLPDGENLYKLYSFIYLRFLATQLKNAVYDQSYIEVDAGGNILSTRANMLLDKGWLIIGTDIINDYKDEYGSEGSVIVPEAMQGDELRPIDISFLKNNTKTPDRYGRGRFITTLENKGIGRPSTLATIVPNLLEKKYVYIDNNMLKPTPLGEKVHEWTKEHFNYITDAEASKELEAKLDLIEKGEADYQELVGFFHEKVEELKLDLGLDPNAPSPQQIEFAKSIAKANGQTLDPSMLRDRNKVSYYIENAPRGEIIGECPFCKKGKVYVNEKQYGCDYKKCDFILWNGGIKSFFERFKKEFDPKQYKALVQHILDNGSVTVDGLTTQKGKTGAIITIEKNKKGDGYWLKIKEYINGDEVSSTDLGEVVTDEQGAKNLVNQVIELSRQNRRLQDQAFKDPLTRAWNRTKFEAERVRFDSAYSLFVAFVDGDKFKSINDTYGHDVGDEVLKYFVNQMAEVLREKSGECYRFGGEEFVIIFEGEDKHEVVRTLEAIRSGIEGGMISVGEHTIKTTVSIGYSNKLKDEPIDVAVKRADEAVYEAKSMGRNRIEAKLVEPETEEREVSKPEAFLW